MEARPDSAADATNVVVVQSAKWAVFALLRSSAAEVVTGAAAASQNGRMRR